MKDNKIIEFMNVPDDLEDLELLDKLDRDSRIHELQEIGMESSITAIPYLAVMAVLYAIGYIMRSPLQFESIISVSLIFGACSQATLLLIRFRKYKAVNPNDVITTGLALIVGVLMIISKSFTLPQ